MTTSLKKLNFFIEDDIRKDMETLIPQGQRSKIINEALRKELLRIRRERVAAELLALKAKGPTATDREILEQLQRDRKRS